MFPPLSTLLSQLYMLLLLLRTERGGSIFEQFFLNEVNNREIYTYFLVYFTNRLTFENCVI